jgi:hypothetical protein
MSDSKREQIEATIGTVLLNEWDPLDVRAQPDRADEYRKYSHDIYGLLIRGASDVQVGRHLHKIEREEMHRADADNRDLSALLKTLRALEKTM